MSSIVITLVYCQALGAGIGALTAVWGELAYIRAMRDGNIDAAERAHLRAIGNGLRFGLILLLLASFGFVVVAYMQGSTLQPALSPDYWILMALALVVIGVSWALARRRIPFALGSAALFAAWWFLVYFSFGWLSPLSFGAAVMSFIVATAIFYGVLYYVRLLASPA